MSQADSIPTTNPSDVSLTRKGQRYAANHDPNAEYFAALATLRREAMAEIDRLLQFLDNLDGDVDLEDGGDDEPSSDEEASLGWTTTGQGGGFYYNAADLDCEHDTANDEPSLACPETVRPMMIAGPYDYPPHGRDDEGSQEHWAKGNGRDLEEEVGRDNREAVDAE
jgi:hypothetical protein